jgi:capsular polysaccharide transport system permease protein
MVERREAPETDFEMENQDPVENVRSPGQVTWSVWKALFLREVLFRLTASRTAWVWMLLEPVAHVAVLMLIYAFIRQREPFGVPGPLFMMTGILAFFMMRNTFIRCTDAVSANTAFLIYRQVKPVDTVLVRAVVEGFLYLIEAMILLVGANFFGYSTIPDDPVTALLAFGLLWVIGTGMGLVFSAFSSLFPDIGKTVKMLNRPLYMGSCVVWPSLFIPQPYQDWIILNPIVHGVEAMRAAFFPFYHVPSQISLIYLAWVSQIIVFLGLALHISFAKRFMER